MTHKFKAGQHVYFHPAKMSMEVTSQRFTIVRTLPVERGEVTYRIKCTAENFERVAKESELSRKLQDSP
jgi:hypothetical protein